MIQLERAATPARPATGHAHVEAVERAVSLIRTHFAEPDTLHRLSEVAWLSRFHLHRVFCEVTGASPGRFLAAVRMEAAKRLLLDPRLRVMDVCYEVGYGSVGTFTSQFTALVGAQPRRFRRLARAHGHLPVELPPAVLGDRHGEEGLSGTIGCEDGFSGWACLGLFRSRVPQGPPVACALAPVPGRFSIAQSRSSEPLHLLAVGMPQVHRMIDLLIPDQSRIRVGWTPPGQRAGDRHVALRPMRRTDPPVVLAYPLLLLERLPAAPLSSGAAR